ncbi:hypothetical protein GCM10023097_23860 [Streptomyces collinus]|uniref:Restriction endonuclease type IV Mrr domain-containing protein n=1 Tax=Streptomyces collinus TaxID=42684 RepID=A0AA89QM12_STRCU|nr:hypothetical protein [Streptomyces collinus]
MTETVAVRCPACRREHRYTAPAYPCACGAPVAPRLDRDGSPTPVSHRVWQDDWVTVRCGSCGRHGEWPHPEVGCACGVVLRVAVVEGRGGIGDHHPASGGTSPAGSARTGRDAAVGQDEPSATEATAAGDDGGCQETTRARDDGGAQEATAAGDDAGRRETTTARDHTNGRETTTARDHTDGRETTTAHDDGSGQDAAPCLRPPAGPHPEPASPQACAADDAASADTAAPTDAAPHPEAPTTADATPAASPTGTGDATSAAAGDSTPATSTAPGDAAPAHTSAAPADATPARPPFRSVTIRTALDAVTATALYLRWLGYRGVRRADQRPPSGIGLAARGVVAQVDPAVRPAGLRDVECLWLTAMTESADGLYFSLAGYADDARARADALGVPLFVLDLTGTPRPVNAPAETLAATGSGKRAP